MAVPKRRMSRANTRARRSQWKADNVALQEVKIDGQVHMVPRRLVKAAQLGLVDVKQFQLTSSGPGRPQAFQALPRRPVPRVGDGSSAFPGVALSADSAVRGTMGP